MMQVLLAILIFYLVLGVIGAIGAIKVAEKSNWKLSRRDKAIIFIQTTLFWLYVFISVVIDEWRYRNGKD